MRLWEATSKVWMVVMVVDGMVVDGCGWLWMVGW